MKLPRPVAALADPCDCIRNAACAAMRFAIGWHLAYMGVWALTSSWDFSWVGRFRCARWILGGILRPIGESCAAGCAADAILAWGLLAAGILLMLGRLVRPAAAFGIFYLALMYILNPPHFGHTGESHYLYIDRNIVEICMLLCVMARACAAKAGKNPGADGNRK